MFCILLKQSKLSDRVIYAVFLTQFSQQGRLLAGASVWLLAFIDPARLNINYWLKMLFNHFQCQVHRRPSSHCQYLREPHHFVTSIFSASCLPLHLMSYFTSMINVLYLSFSTRFS